MKKHSDWREDGYGELVDLNHARAAWAERLTRLYEPYDRAAAQDWSFLQLCLRTLGRPALTARWEYQLPAINRLIVVEDEGRLAEKPVSVTVTGLLRHHPKSRAYKALEQIETWHVQEVDVLRSSVATVWKIIEERTIGYKVAMVPAGISDASGEDTIYKELWRPRANSGDDWEADIIADGLRGATEYYEYALDINNTRIHELTDIVRDDFEPHLPGGERVATSS